MYKAGSLDLQAPQLPETPSLSAGIRLAAPHAGQRIRYEIMRYPLLGMRLQTGKVYQRNNRWEVGTLVEMNPISGHVALFSFGDTVLLSKTNCSLTADGKIIPLNIKVGDRVLFGKYAETGIKIGEEQYLILREDDILGVME